MKLAIVFVLLGVVGCNSKSGEVGAACSSDGDCDRNYCLKGFCAAGCTCTERICRTGTECSSEEVCVAFLTTVDRKPRCARRCDTTACPEKSFCDREDEVCREGTYSQPTPSVPTPQTCSALGASCSETVPCCMGTCTATNHCK